MVLSFLLMGWGNKNHSLFLFHHPVSWKAWYFYLHCPRQCHVSMPFPWEFRSQRAFMTEANTRNPVPFWLQARYTFRSTSHPSWKQTWGRSCFPKPLVARRLPAHSVHAPGQQHIPTDWTTHTWKTRCAQKKDSFFSSLILGASTFTVPAWRDMTPSRRASVLLSQGHLGLAWVAQAHWVWESGSYWLQGRLGPA